MTYTGRVQNGVIVLDDADAKLPEGEAVQINFAAEKAPRTTLSERFKDFIGTVQGLPEDMAENHDHYIHGTPKSDNASDPDAPVQSAYEKYQSVIGSIKDMPSDLAAEHDHYLYGTPKKDAQ